MLDPIVGFLQALSVNLSIGLSALVVGLMVGFLTAFVRLSTHPLSARSMNFVMGILRAVPSYVLMVVGAAIFSTSNTFAMFDAQTAALLALFLALLAGTVSSCSDACVTFLQCRAQGKYAQAWLIIPSAFQIFIVAVMTSGVGVAIGVQEAVYYTLSLAETYESRTDRILLVVVVMLFFAAILASAKYLVGLASKRFLTRL